MNNEPQNINYQPLEAISHAYAATIKSSFATARGWLYLAVFVIFSALGVVTKFYTLTGIAVMLYVAYFYGRAAMFKNNVWTQFATVNGWTLDTTTSVLVMLPALLRFGHSYQFSPIIKATVEGISFDLFTYTCETGSGRSTTMHYFTVAQLSLPVQLPHIVLRTKDNEADTQNDLERGESLQLEGDFSKYFILEVEKGQEVEALTVMTPDVMRTVMDYGKSEDIEIMGNQLYFIIRGDKRNPDTIKQLVQSATELSKQLVENAALAGKTTANVTVLPTETIAPASLISQTRWNLTRMFSTKPSGAEWVLIAIIIIMIVGLFTWVFIAVANTPQYN